MEKVEGKLRGPFQHINYEMSYFFEMCTQEGQPLDPAYLPFHPSEGRSLWS